MSAVPKLNTAEAARKSSDSGYGASPRGFMGSFYNVFTPRSVKQRDAAIRIQCAARVMIARKRARRAKQRAVIYRLAWMQEKRAVVHIQNKFRAKLQARAAVKLQAIAKGRADRKQVEYLKERNEKVEAFQQKRSATVIQKNIKNRPVENWDKLREELQAVTEKKGKKLAFAGYEMVFWQSRHITVNQEAIVYCHIGPASQPKPLSQKTIKFKDIKTVSQVTPTKQMVIIAQERDYIFHWRTNEECEQWVNGVKKLLRKYEQDAEKKVDK